MKNTKISYLILTLCYCLFNSPGHASTFMDEWSNPQGNFQIFSQSNALDEWDGQIDDITYKRPNKKEQESYLDISLKNESPVLRFSYTSKNYLSYSEGSPLKYFVEEVKDFYSRNKPKEVSIDLSNHFFSTIELEDIYNDLQKENINISSLNLSRTGVDSNIKEIIKDLLKKDSFKYINISETPASEDKETFKDIDNQQQQKVIFIAPEYLDIVKSANIISGEIISNHQNYYRNLVNNKILY